MSDWRLEGDKRLRDGNVQNVRAERLSEDKSATGAFGCLEYVDACGERPVRKCRNMMYLRIIFTPPLFFCPPPLPRNTQHSPREDNLRLPHRHVRASVRIYAHTHTHLCVLLHVRHDLPRGVHVQVLTQSLDEVLVRSRAGLAPGLPHEPPCVERHLAVSAAHAPAKDRVVGAHVSRQPAPKEDVCGFDECLSGWVGVGEVKGMEVEGVRVGGVCMFWLCALLSTRPHVCSAILLSPHRTHPRRIVSLVRTLADSPRLEEINVCACVCVRACVCVCVCRYPCE